MKSPSVDPSWENTKLRVCIESTALIFQLLVFYLSVKYLRGQCSSTHQIAWIPHISVFWLHSILIYHFRTLGTYDIWLTVLVDVLNDFPWRLDRKKNFYNKFRVKINTNYYALKFINLWIIYLFASLKINWTTTYMHHIIYIQVLK